MEAANGTNGVTVGANGSVLAFAGQEAGGEPAGEQKNSEDENGPEDYGAAVSGASAAR